MVVLETTAVVDGKTSDSLSVSSVESTSLFLVELLVPPDVNEEASLLLITDFIVTLVLSSPAPDVLLELFNFSLFLLTLELLLFLLEVLVTLIGLEFKLLLFLLELKVFGNKFELEAILDLFTLSFRFKGFLCTTFLADSESSDCSLNTWDFAGTFGLFKEFTFAWTCLYFCTGILEGDSGVFGGFVGLESLLPDRDGFLDCTLDWFLEAFLEIIAAFDGAGFPVVNIIFRLGDCFLLGGVLRLLGIREGEDTD